MQDRERDFVAQCILIHKAGPRPLATKSIAILTLCHNLCSSNTMCWKRKRYRKCGGEECSELESLIHNLSNTTFSILYFSLFLFQYKKCVCGEEY